MSNNDRTSESIPSSVSCKICRNYLSIITVLWDSLKQSCSMVRCYLIKVFFLFPRLVSLLFLDILWASLFKCHYNTQGCQVVTLSLLQVPKDRMLPLSVDCHPVKWLQGLLMLLIRHQVDRGLSCHRYVSFTQARLHYTG